MTCNTVEQIRDQVTSGQLTLEDITRTANSHLAENRLEDAFACIAFLAEARPDDADTSVTAGLVALTLKRRPEAITYFEKALSKNPGHYDAAYNLALALVSDGKQEQAIAALKKLLKRNPDNASLLSDLAVIQAEAGNLGAAVDYWSQALRKDPNLGLARKNAVEILLKNKMPAQAARLLELNEHHAGVTAESLADIQAWKAEINPENHAAIPETSSPEHAGTTPARPPHKRGLSIALFASIDTFFKDIADYLTGQNEITRFTGQSVEDMQQMLRQADLAWFEWCDQYLIEATKLPKTCPIICRLHSYEAFTDMPSKVDWSKVDLLIFVNRSVKELFERQVKTPVSSIVIHNAVDTDKFVIPRQKKIGRRIASVGYINYKKNPALLLYCFKKIHEYDSNYTLHIAGEHQDPRIQVYFEHFLKENPLPIYFDGWVDDMPRWYADKDFVISTSLFESFHYSIAEGMSCGLMPLIHNWYGAANLYPKEFLFNDPDNCLELLLKLEREDRIKLAESNREFIQHRYHRKDKLEEIDRAIKAVIRTNQSSSRSMAGARS